MASQDSRLRLLSCLALVLAAILPATAQQQEIECIVPQKMGGDDRPVYSTGDTVQFQWKSTFPRFDLTITQVNSETQQKTNDKIFDNESNATSNYVWTAQNFDGLSQNDSFHLWITNADDTDCDLCHCRSANFTVLDVTTTNSSSTTASTSSANSSNPASTPSTAASSNTDDEHLRLGLRLGLGLGIPLLIILTALATWLCARRRRQERRASLTAGSYGGSLSTPSSAIPLHPAKAYTQSSSLGYTSDSPEKSPAPEMDGREVLEMQTDTERVEAPQNAVRAELAGDDGMNSTMRDFKPM